MALCMLRLFLEAALPDNGCVANFVQDLWRDGRSFCNHYSGGDDCGHVALADLPDLPTSGSIAAQAVDSLCVLMPHVVGCAGCRHVVLCAVDVFQQRIDRFICEQHRETLPHKVPPRQRATKGVMADDTFRKYAAKKVMQQRRAKNGKGMVKMEGFAKSSYHRWVRKEMCAYAVACNRMLQPKNTIAIYEDASRLGNPAREILLMLGYCCDSRLGCVMPPQVHIVWM